MTDQTIPADKVRTILDEWERIKEHADWDDIDNLVQDVRALLPAPPRLTLADMTRDEQDECAGMQADLAQGDRVVILDGTPDAAGLVQVLEKSLDVYRAYPKEVTPRPDLPPLPWPGTEKPAPAPALPDGWRLADHPEYGRVIVTNTTPAGDARVYYVFHSADPLGFDWLFCDHSELTYIDSPTTEEDDTPTGSDHLAVGTVIESADDPRLAALPAGSVLLDCDGETVAKRPGVWVGIGYIPIPSQRDEFGPWTVLHIPKEADQ